MNDGPVVGLNDVYDTQAFLGLPFAAPPVGALRWRAPASVEPWTEPRLAQDFSQMCPQLEATQDEATGETIYVPVGNEDCLYLNVWRPRAPAESARPIMVFLHGGGNGNGTATTPLYNGARVAAEGDVVVVTLEYRLNVMGWFKHPETATGDAEEDSGNFGMLDQMQALRWVKANAAALGADPDNVTLFGESAGGFDIWSLVLSPLAEGLFQRGIVESGCADFLTVDEALADSAGIVEALVVLDGLATEEGAADYVAAQPAGWAHDYLYAKSAVELMAPYETTGGFPLAQFDPVEDGHVLPQGTLNRLAAGDYRATPMIIGSNRDEMKLFLSQYYGMGRAQFTALMNLLYGENAEEIIALYPIEAYSPATYYNQFTDIQDWYTELVCALWAAQLTSRWQPVWTYSFRYDDLTPPLDNLFGAAHGFELPFVFGNMGDDAYAEGTFEERQRLASATIGYWTCFARTGDPGACGGRSWPAFVEEGEMPFARMELDGVWAATSTPEVDLLRLEYWLNLGDLAGLRSMSEVTERAAAGTWWGSPWQ